MSDTLREQLSALCIYEVLSHVLDVVWREKRPARIYVDGIDEDLVGVFNEKHVDDYGSHRDTCVQADNDAQADIVITRKSESNYQCTRLSGDLRDTGVFWQVDVRVSVVKDHDIVEDDSVDYLGASLHEIASPKKEDKTDARTRTSEMDT